MFTGIIKKLSRVAGAQEKNGTFLVSIEIPRGWKIKPGDSVAINGVCSTVKTLKSDAFEVEYMPETLRKTTVGSFKRGIEVNLEKSMGLNDLLDGHIVQGHIDTRGLIKEIKEVKRSRIIKIKVPRKFMALIAEKGSVSVDGISLTVVDIGKDWFTISLVEYTLENTNLGNIKKNTAVNIETDVIAKYIYKILKKK